MKTRGEGIPGGRLWLGGEGPDAEAVRRFVVSGEALKLPPECRLGHHTRHGAVYVVEIAGVGRCVLKEFRILRDRGLFRRLESAFKLLFVHRGLRTMRLAGRLAAAGVRTIDPLAFWTDTRGAIRNFLLYRFIEGEVFGEHWMGELAAISPPSKADAAPAPEALEAFFGRAGEMVRRMHDAGVVHTDLHPKNFIAADVSHPADTLALIDLDSAHPSSSSGRIAFNARMRSLRRLAQCFKDEDAPLLRLFVRSYSQEDPETEAAVLRALRFWRGRKWHSISDVVLSWLRCPPPRPVDRRGRTEYDMVFSIGYDCKCSQSLRRAGLQHFSYPCDWLTGAPLRERARIVAGGFRDWFRLEDLEDIGTARFNRFAGMKRIAKDRRNGLEFRHDFPAEGSLAEGFPEAAAKYERRSERLLDAIGKAGRALAVFCDGYGCPPVSLADLRDARDILAGRFGEKIDVLGIFDDAPGTPHEAAEAASADGHVRRWSLPCLRRSPDGLVVRDRVVARALAARVSCPDPHSPAERRARREADRAAIYAKYKAKSWLGMTVNRLLFRHYRSLTRLLQKKGIIPANSANNPVSQS